MQSDGVAASVAPLETTNTFHFPSQANYIEAERQLGEFLLADDLDGKIEQEPALTQAFDSALEAAINSAYKGENSPEAHLFLQRVLYRINRLKLFWYDDLNFYKNERSEYLRRVRDRVEAEWQTWELDQLDVEKLKTLDVKEALMSRSAEDLDPPASETGRFFRDEAREAAYRRLLEIFSLDGLVEASQLCRTMGGASNRVHEMLTRVLVEEYGGGRLHRKHSSYFKTMLDDLKMNAEPEGYFERTPWEVLASINLSFLLSERKLYFLRYIGGLMYTEVSVPAGFQHYRDTAARLGLSKEAMAYWDLHIKEDEKHGQWMLNDVALPLVDKYNGDAWQLLLGYDQQRFVSDRAATAIMREARQADSQAAA